MTLVRKTRRRSRGKIFLFRKKFGGLGEISRKVVKLSLGGSGVVPGTDTAVPMPWRYYFWSANFFW